MGRKSHFKRIVIRVRDSIDVRIYARDVPIMIAEIVLGRAGELRRVLMSVFAPVCIFVVFVMNFVG